MTSTVIIFKKEDNLNLVHGKRFFDYDPKETGEHEYKTNKDYKESYESKGYNNFNSIFNAIMTNGSRIIFDDLRKEIKYSELEDIFEMDINKIIDKYNFRVFPYKRFYISIGSEKDKIYFQVNYYSETFSEISCEDFYKHYSLKNRKANSLNDIRSSDEFTIVIVDISRDVQYVNEYFSIEYEKSWLESRIKEEETFFGEEELTYQEKIRKKYMYQKELEKEKAYWEKDFLKKIFTIGEDEVIDEELYNKKLSKLTSSEKQELAVYLRFEKKHELEELMELAYKREYPGMYSKYSNDGFPSIFPIKKIEEVKNTIKLIAKSCPELEGLCLNPDISDIFDFTDVFDAFDISNLSAKEYNFKKVIKYPDETVKLYSFCNLFTVKEKELMNKQLKEIANNKISKILNKYSEIKKDKYESFNFGDSYANGIGIGIIYDFFSNDYKQLNRLNRYMSDLIVAKSIYMLTIIEYYLKFHEKIVEKFRSREDKINKDKILELLIREKDSVITDDLNNKDGNLEKYKEKIKEILKDNNLTKLEDLKEKEELKIITELNKPDRVEDKNYTISNSLKDSENKQVYKYLKLNRYKDLYKELSDFLIDKYDMYPIKTNYGDDLELYKFISNKFNLEEKYLDIEKKLLMVKDSIDKEVQDEMLRNQKERERKESKSNNRRDLIFVIIGTVLAALQVLLAFH